MENKRVKMRNVFLVVAACLLLYWLLMHTERFFAVCDRVLDILSPFIIGAVIAFILNVPVRGFERLLKRIKRDGLRRGLAIFLALLSVLLVLALILPLLVIQLVDTYNDLEPRIYDFFAVDLKNWATNVLADFPQVQEFILNNTDMKNFDLATIIMDLFSFVGTSLTTVAQGLFSAIGSTVSGIFNAFVAFAFSIYCLFQKDNLSRQGRKLLYAFVPEKAADYIIRVLRMANVTFSNFISGQCIEVLILGVMFAIAMAILGLPHILLISVLVAITAFIPVVGAWVGCIIGAFLILVSSPIQALWFVILFLVLQEIENNLIYPKVVGTSIGLSGMWVLVAVSVGGSLMGVTGMFFMIPVTSVLYAVIRDLVDSRLKKKGIDEEKLKPHPIERKEEHHKKSDPVCELEPEDLDKVTSVVETSAEPEVSSQESNNATEK